MQTNKIFSLPLNPKLTLEQFEDFVRFVDEHKHLINDIYFTSRIAPFDQDAMGEVFVINDDKLIAIEAALHIQRVTGVTASATFNNIYVPPTQQNLDLWIEKFKPLYDAGIRSVTLPHTHWIATGCIQQAYPDLYIKNTILREVTKPAEIVALAEAGFHYVNLDRDIMRDHDAILAVKKAKEWLASKDIDIKVSLLANEGCLGNCPMMVEHFHFNCARTGDTPQYFNDPISRVSCPKWDNQDPSVHLKAANLPPWRGDWAEMLDNGIDVFKLHGRESVSRLYESMDIIRRWNQDAPYLFDTFEEYIKDNNLKEKPIDAWRMKIKTCKFECWNCNYCDKIYMKKSDNQINPLVSFVAECIDKSGTPQMSIDVPGLTSPRVQEFIRLLMCGAEVYAEVGSFVGATASAALAANPRMVICVDNWKTPIATQKDHVALPENNKALFIENIEKYKQSTIIKMFNTDMLSVAVKDFKTNVDVFFYDGPHDFDNTSKAVQHYSKRFGDQVVVIFDDANWEGVVSGAQDGLSKINFDVIYERKLLNDIEDEKMWWNGLYVVVLERRR